jgi:hypothetical protein
MAFFLVLKAEVVRSFITLRRYWFAALTGILMSYGLLMMLIFGFMTKGDEIEEAATGITAQFADPSSAMNAVLGFIIGVFAFGIVGMFSQGLSGMARSGELEQVCMSPHGLVTNFMARTLVSAIQSILSSAIMLWLVKVTVNGDLNVDPGLTVLLLGLLYLNLIGFGFMVGGLVLVFKQTGQIAMLIRLAMLGLGVAASEKMATWPLIVKMVAHALPVTDGAVCLKLMLIERYTAAEVMQHSSFHFLLVSCVIWTVVGVSLFRLMENHSRSKGTLGAY